MPKIDKLKRAIIKEELVVAIEYRLNDKGISTRDSYKLAILLNQALYWTERVGQEKYQRFLIEESRREVDDIAELKGGWIYKNAEEWAEDCLLGVSSQTVRRWFEKLIKIGYILERNNPKVKFDHTVQYRLNLVKLIEDLNKLGYKLEGYKTASLLNLQNGESRVQNGNSKVHNGASNLQSGGTIPEITTESTTDNATQHKEQEGKIESQPNHAVEEVQHYILSQTKRVNLGKEYLIIEDLKQYSTAVIKKACDLAVTAQESRGNYRQGDAKNGVDISSYKFIRCFITEAQELLTQNLGGANSGSNISNTPKEFTEGGQYKSEQGEEGANNSEIQEVEISIEDL
ncbi:hypothetical protein BX659_13146 [Orenia metallireducens]|jgi:hypothetical protein|uniref:Uncharacterized protein n=1 Tax=Orenia metallireducens TaxID=1413210 RepID=A0A285I9F7_9FIRM|nr:hypothetical protein [Orenia metallireducens]PRX21704.1 hypothetical protein BX659_13146 [Orenia metallireducens]SNY44533.1 hypothetical protein SAMN06265827_13446 [Orenia metallireducens]